MMLSVLKLLGWAGKATWSSLTWNMSEIAAYVRPSHLKFFFFIITSISFPTTLTVLVVRVLISCGPRWL